MNKFFSSSLFMKILSVIFAVFLWIVALNSENPLDVKIVTVALEQKNSFVLTQNNLGLYKTVIPKHIDITIHGRDEALRKVTSGDFEATIDFSGIKKSGVFSLPLIVENNNNGIYINDISQKLVQVTVEKIIKKAFEVDLKTEGTLKEKYLITNAFLSSNIIEVEGIEPEVEKISTVVAPLHYENLSESMSTLIHCHFFDSLGNEIIAQRDKFSVSANVEVAKEVSIVPVVTGTPQQYYFIEDQKVDPNKVLVQGSPAVLNELASINISPVSIEGANNNISAQTTVNLPEGVSLYNPEQIFTLSVTLDKLKEADYYVSKEQITVIFADNKYIYDIKDPGITVKLIEKEKDRELYVEQIIPSINVKGLETGVHELPVQVLVPDWIIVDGEYFITVEIFENTDNTNPTDDQTTFIPH